jgi:3-oxoacyl-[acyl-carrier-protein] synthase II
MSSLRDVVITGLGVVSPLGIGREALWSALESGHSGVDWLPEYQGSELPFRIGARVKDFDPKQYVQPRKTIKVMCAEIQYAYAAAMLAMEDAGLAKGAVEPERLGVVLGSEMLFGELDEVQEVFRNCAEDGRFVYDRWGVQAFKDQYPLWMLKYLPNMAACHISIVHDARGPNNSIVQGAASSLLAVIEAATCIERGLVDAMLAGGSGSLVSPSSLPFRGWDHLTRWTGPPAEASRPFDARRSGVVPGEGAATLMLESREHAEQRGANILACIAGFGRRFEATRRGQPLSGVAIERAIAAALTSSTLQPRDVGHVNAHGESSSASDALEARAIRSVLGEVPVLAPKSYCGDLGAGSGAVELAISVLALVQDCVPPTLNYQSPDPACPVNVVHGSPLLGAKPSAVVLNHSNTGQAAAVVLTRS